MSWEAQSASIASGEVCAALQGLAVSSVLHWGQNSECTAPRKAARMNPAPLLQEIRIAFDRPEEEGELGSHHLQGVVNGLQRPC